MAILDSCSIHVLKGYFFINKDSIIVYSCRSKPVMTFLCGTQKKMIFW